MVEACEFCDLSALGIKRIKPLLPPFVRLSYLRISCLNSVWTWETDAVLKPCTFSRCKYSFITYGIHIRSRKKQKNIIRRVLATP